MPQPHQKRRPPIPPAVIRTTTQTLADIFLRDTLASKAIATALKAQPRWTPDERAAFSTTIYDLVRHWRLLWFLQDHQPTCRQHDIPRLLDIYRLYKKTLADPNAPTPLHNRLRQTNANRAIRESIPDWLDTACAAELGHRWDSILHALNTPPPLTLRTNTLKITRARLTLALKEEGIHPTPLPWAPDTLCLPARANVFRLRSFQQGYFEVQDPASQMVSRLLDPKPGMRVTDACAGEGGKTLHLAALMNNTGRIIALDPSTQHLQQLRRRATRAGADTIETRILTAAKSIKRLTGTMDRVLIDAPCSGLGTLKKNPDIKWKLTPDALDRLRRLQRDLLDTYPALLKPDGRFVYAVCSILYSEGEQQTAAFLTRHKTYRLLREHRYSPDTDGTDGFYMALLQRTE